MSFFSMNMYYIHEVTYNLALVSSTGDAKVQGLRLCIARPRAKEDAAARVALGQKQAAKSGTASYILARLGHILCFHANYGLGKVVVKSIELRVGNAKYNEMALCSAVERWRRRYCSVAD